MLILRTFAISRLGTIAGCRVLSGTIHRNARMRVIRDNRIVGDYAMESLRREKDDVKEVAHAYDVTLNDPGVFEGPWTENWAMERKPNWKVLEFICDDNDRCRAGNCTDADVQKSSTQ